jgi:arabinofuranosyltransferase
MDHRMDTITIEQRPVDQTAGTAPTRWTRQQIWNFAAIGLVVALFAVLAWHRRWVHDDGMIVLRTVQNILDGNGPVFNVGERVEANTSTLWTYLLVLIGLIPGLSLEWAAVISGLLFAIAGVFLGLDGARRLYNPTGATFVVPAGALVVCALPPFWDFATSGLETGLVTLWLAGAWWLLVARAIGRSAGPIWLTAVVLGLGPLVRPEMALFSAVAFVALLVICRPGWVRGLLWAAAAAVLPVGYQIFRMGYYGLITPNTALAKEAGKARWEMGWRYFGDLLGSYELWTPLVLLVLAAGVLMVRSKQSDNINTVVVIGTPLVVAAGMAIYVTRVGGDYMHARMLLPAVLCLMLPVFVVPLTRWTSLPLVAIGAWAIVAAVWLRPPYVKPPNIGIGTEGISDARVPWPHMTGTSHPILAKDAANIPGYLPELIATRGTPTGPTVSVKGAGPGTWSVYPAAGERSTVASPGALGFVALGLPLDQKVIDDIGLANPLASHATNVPGPMGHDKLLPTAWTVADAAKGTGQELSVLGGGVISANEIEAARTALDCPRIKEMLESVRAPLTADRFWDNFTGAFGRSSLRYDRDPLKAQTCG